MIMEWLSGMQAEFIIRLIAAALCGGALGIERERRQKSAGIRTHVVVAIASALMMIISKYGFFDVLFHGSISLDPSRVVSGVVSAIGFLGAGIIFVRHSSAIGLTTAAGIWATVAIGIAMGAGMYFLAIISTLLLIAAQALLHMKSLPFNKVTEGFIKIDLTSQGLDIDSLREMLAAKGMSFRGFKTEKDSSGHLVFSGVVAIDMKRHEADIIKFIESGCCEEFRIL